MTDFTEKMRLRGKAEEDLYFAELDRKLIRALREKQIARKNKEEPDQCDKNSKSEEDK
jgi:hypothetical protein